jgi:7-cyano-7-deazaguanine synthase
MDIVVLFSGGLDSTTLAQYAKDEGDRELHLLTFDYGQTHDLEIGAAVWLAENFLKPKTHRVMRLELPDLVKSRLVGTQDGDLATMTLEEMGANSPAYVPGRNTIFVSLGLGLAESIGAKELWVGATANDDQGFPDCRYTYFRAWDSLIEEMGCDVRLRFDFVARYKKQVIEYGASKNVPFERTVSCYKMGAPLIAALQGGIPLHCGRCDACTTRKAAFGLAKIDDPTEYAVDL